MADADMRAAGGDLMELWSFGDSRVQTVHEWPEESRARQARVSSQGGPSGRACASVVLVQPRGWQLMNSRRG